MDYCSLRDAGDIDSNCYDRVVKIYRSIKNLALFTRKFLNILFFSPPDNPTITTLESQNYPIYELSFPGIAICPSNKISKRNAEAYADYLLNLSNLDSNYRSKEKLVDLIRYFGRLYDADIEGAEVYGNFQDILDSIDSDNNTGVFDSEKKLRFLAPKCEDFIVKCKWGGEMGNCSQIIRFRRTYIGERLGKT